MRQLASALGLPEPAGELWPAGPAVLAGSGGQYPASWPAALTPAQLPAEAGRLSGRAAELAEQTRWLDEADGGAGTVVIAAICGAAGVGKTALALRFAYRVASRTASCM
jgi:hypothetical protein